MTFYKANVADVLRLVQRDEGFLRDTEENLQAFFKLIGPQYYPRLFKNVPLFANIWYYSMTSLGNLQTLGEEYTGTIRLCNNRVPSKWVCLIFARLKLQFAYFTLVDASHLVITLYWR